jgi:hypothetical protein
MKAVIGGSNTGAMPHNNTPNLHPDNSLAHARRGTPGQAIAKNGNAIISPYKRAAKNTSIISNQNGNSAYQRGSA